MVDNENSTPPLPITAQTRIGLKLRRLYDSIASEPVPDRFTQLLADLEKAQGNPPVAAKADAEPKNEGGVDP